MDTTELHELQLISFRHCTAASILCFVIPDQCPLCQACLTNTRLPSPPVRYPSVFTTANVSPCSIVIQPTQGTFLNDYKDGANLHAGITNTKGAVYSFDEEGVHVESGKLSWKQCVAVKLLDQYDDDIMDVWDMHLKTVARMEDWNQDRYHEVSHNCFDFVVGFLNFIDFYRLKWNKPGTITREDLCREYIVPQTARAGKYISVYRSVQEKGFVVQR